MTNGFNMNAPSRLSPLKTVPGTADGTAFGSARKSESKQFFNKTVTNFASVRYDNNGGLNPVSPAKRGLALQATSNTISHPGHWRNSSQVQ